MWAKATKMALVKLNGSYENFAFEVTANGQNHNVFDTFKGQKKPWAQHLEVLNFPAAPMRRRESAFVRHQTRGAPASFQLKPDDQDTWRLNTSIDHRTASRDRAKLRSTRLHFETCFWQFDIAQIATHGSHCGGEQFSKRA